MRRRGFTARRDPPATQGTRPGGAPGSPTGRDQPLRRAANLAQAAGTPTPDRLVRALQRSGRHGTAERRGRAFPRPAPAAVSPANGWPSKRTRPSPLEPPRPGLPLTKDAPAPRRMIRSAMARPFAALKGLDGRGGRCKKRHRPRKKFTRSMPPWHQRLPQGCSRHFHDYARFPTRTRK